MNQPLFDLPEGEPQRRRRLSPEREESASGGFVDQFMYLLTAPYIGWPGWEDQVAAQKEQIVMHRFIHASQIFEQEMATEFEAMMYISSASLSHPLNHEWAEIYGWLFCRWKPDEGKEIWEREIVLDRTQIEELNRLRRWIFRRQMDHLKSRGRPPQADQGKEVASKEQEPEVQQPSMFDFDDEGE